MRHALIALLAGVMFGVGLALSGMTDTQVVLGFLDLAGNWNPTLAFVMGGALLVTLPAFAFVLRRSTPAFAPQFELPSKHNIDAELVAGAVMFGAGWGLYGYCPGPALASLAAGQAPTVLFVAAMAVGMILQDRLQDRKARC